MKALLAGPYPYPTQKISGGVESVLVNLHNGFKKYINEKKISVLSASTHAKSSYERIKDITYIKQPKYKFGSVFLSLYPKKIRNFYNQNNFDIINAHEIEFAYYALKKNKNMIFTMHGFPWIENKFLPNYQRHAYSYFYLRKLKKIFDNLKYFISINDYGKQLIEKKTNAQIYDIQNPVDEKLFDIKAKTEENRFLFIGSISRMKNLFTLIKALNLIKKDIKNFKLHIAGNVIDKAYFNEINLFINKNGLKENIKFLGVINNKEKYREFSKMSLLILPSLNEHAPMVISEAFASGKTVIASSVGGIPYMVQDNVNGLLINPKNIKNIAEKILYSSKNPSILKKLEKNALNYAKKYNSPKSVANKYNSVFKEILF